MTLLLDLTHTCCEHTDAALEALHKAIGEPPDDGAWDPHPSPLVRRMVELFTERGLTRIAGVQAELNRWLAGEQYRDGLVRPARPAAAREAWSQAELAIVKLYLESLPPEEFTLDDWMLVVDYLSRRYLSPDDLRSEAEWLASRAAIMGRVQAAMGDVEPTVEEADRLLAAMAKDARAEAGMSPHQRAVIEYGRARCVENVVALSESIRHRMRKLIVDRQEAEFLGDRTKTAESLQTQLLDAFGTMNRDWRRIAITEATENVNQGLIASLKHGTRVRRVEKYRGACPFCRSINGKIMIVVDPSAEPKDGDKEVWVGKTNVGRSASPRKREGNRLVDREPKEKWWIASGAMHPHCRGSWVVIEDTVDPGVDPAFSDWMDEVLGLKP